MAKRLVDNHLYEINDTVEAEILCGRKRPLSGALLKKGCY